MNGCERDARDIFFFFFFYQLARGDEIFINVMINILAS